MQSSEATRTKSSAARRRWIALAALAVAQFMVFLDETVVNVALPSIKSDLAFSQATLAWVVSIYIVVFGGLVLLGGRVADLLGRRCMILLGGAITQAASWRSVFLINVPVALAALAVIPRLIADSRAALRRGFDVAGAVSVTAGMTTLVYAIVKAPDYGWASPVTHALFAAALGSLAAFAAIERRSAAPLIPARFLQRRATLAPNLLQLLLGVSAISSLFLLTLYTQQVLAYTPLQAGVAYLPLAAGVATATAIANRLVART